MTDSPRLSVLPLPLPSASPPPSLSWPSAADTEGVTNALALPDTLLPGHHTNLFVQARLSEATHVAPLAQHARVGVVLTMEHKGYTRPVQKMLAAVATVRQGGSLDCDILVDRNLYSGSSNKDPLFGEHRKTAADGLSRQWVDDQLLHLGLPAAVTDSGYCRTVQDVKRVLADAAPFPRGTVTLLPIPFHLVRDDAVTLVDAINNHAHHVAIVLEHEADPFDEDGVAVGCVWLIRNADRPPVFLRSDTSALGLIAHGAAGGAVGTHSEFRHLFPQREGGRPIPEKLAFVIPELLGFYTQKRFQDAYLRAAHLPAWRCPCWFCDKRDLTWIDAQPKQLKKTAAFQHSVCAVAELGARLQGHVASGQSRPRAWDAMCGLAQAEHDDVSNPSGSSWQPKVALKHWRSVTPPVTVS